MLVRFWDSDKDCVQTSYLGSSFFRKTANDIYEKFTFTSEVLDQTKLLQVSSDGPNVSVAFLDLINDERKEKEYSQLIHIGICGLHSLCNALSNCAKASSWKMKELLSAMYKIFNESLSRRADYEILTSATEKDYFLKFCSYWWFENESITRRAQKFMPKYVKITEFWRGLPKSKEPEKGEEGRNNNCDRLVEHQKDVLVPSYHSVKRLQDT